MSIEHVCLYDLLQSSSHAAYLPSSEDDMTLSYIVQWIGYKQICLLNHIDSYEARVFKQK